MHNRTSKFRKKRGKKLWKRALRSEGDQFCALFNARAKWLGLPGRVRFRESRYEVADYEDTVKVRCVSLDDLFPEGERIKLLKVEAEGAEPEILLGGSKMLRNVDFVTADLGFERGVDCESTAPEVVNFMVKNGFEVVEFRHQRVCVLFRNTAT
jgi:hypothetical protein